MSTSTTTLTRINHFINGAESTGVGEQTRPVYNPATGQVTAELRLANEADLNTAVAAAKKAAQSWGDISLAKRTGVLFKFRELVAAHVDELAELITAEHGKVLSDAKGEIGRGLEVIEFACGIPSLLKGDYSD
ncbi:aldehyde dehydrogenase family protein, partial [Paenarthrobacter sp. YIM B13468]|uniref:aldehyde dehydrogenase family protein n=1 Tax=Paenarthrobacter sp. YIM B13468 TaxID=3366295 RepID=UPI0036716AEB